MGNGVWAKVECENAKTHHRHGNLYLHQAAGETGDTARRDTCVAILSANGLRKANARKQQGGGVPVSCFRFKGISRLERREKHATSHSNRWYPAGCGAAHSVALQREISQFHPNTLKDWPPMKDNEAEKERTLPPRVESAGDRYPSVHLLIQQDLVHSPSAAFAIRSRSGATIQLSAASRKLVAMGERMEEEEIFNLPGNAKFGSSARGTNRFSFRDSFALLDPDVVDLYFQDESAQANSDSIFGNSITDDDLEELHRDSSEDLDGALPEFSSSHSHSSDSSVDSLLSIENAPLAHESTSKSSEGGSFAPPSHIASDATVHTSSGSDTTAAPEDAPRNVAKEMEQAAETFVRPRRRTHYASMISQDDLKSLASQSAFKFHHPCFCSSRTVVFILFHCSHGPFGYACSVVFFRPVSFLLLLYTLLYTPLFFNPQ